MVHGPQHFFSEETMSISGLTNSALDSLLAAAQSTQNGQGGLQQIEAEFQQLGQDLQTGNLTEAQEDYTTAGNWPGPPASPSRPGGGQQDNQVSQALDALSTALQSGNLAGAQSAFATLTQTLQLGAGGNSGSINVANSSSSQSNGSNGSNGSNVNVSV
jgi:hypothetical protein